jgi:hypothetical protein
MSWFINFTPNGYLVSVDDKVIWFQEDTICSSNYPIDEEAIIKCIDMTAHLSDDSKLKLQSFTLSLDGVFAATGHSIVIICIYGILQRGTMYCGFLFGVFCEFCSWSASVCDDDIQLLAWALATHILIQSIDAPYSYLGLEGSNPKYQSILLITLAMSRKYCVKYLDLFLQRTLH